MKKTGKQDSFVALLFLIHFFLVLNLILTVTVVSTKAATDSVQEPKISNGRIVGGQETGKHEFPFVVSLQRNGNHFCGGSIINSRWIMTAAHCTVFPASECQIVAGAHNLFALDGSEQTRNIKTMTVHPEFNATSFENDVALWATTDEFIMNDSVGPVKLVDNFTENCNIPDNIIYKTTVIGWGLLDENTTDISHVLQKVDVPIMDQEKCKTIFKNFDQEIVDSMVCAGGELEKDSCSGDSGGPLLCYSSCQNQTSMRQCGIVSFGVGCGRPGDPGVYTRVKFFMDFIQNIVSN